MLRVTTRDHAPFGAATPQHAGVGVPYGRQLPLHKGAFGDGGCGLPRRPVGPPRNDNGFLSFRGAERRGNPLLFTMYGGSGRPTNDEGNGTPSRRALRKAQSITRASGAQRSVCASGCEGWTGIGARTIPKGGPPPRSPGQRLAKRKARKEQLVKFDFCPMTSECSTAYNVRKFQQGPARVLVGAALIGQDGLGPRPVVQEDAERPGCTTRTRFFF